MLLRASFMLALMLAPVGSLALPECCLPTAPVSDCCGDGDACPMTPSGDCELANASHFSAVAQPDVQVASGPSLLSRMANVPALARDGESWKPAPVITGSPPGRSLLYLAHNSWLI